MRDDRDRNNIDKIGDVNSPGLKVNELTREQKRDHLAGKGIRDREAQNKILDLMYPVDRMVPRYIPNASFPHPLPNYDDGA